MRMGRSVEGGRALPNTHTHTHICPLASHRALPLSMASGPPNAVRAEVPKRGSVTLAKSPILIEPVSRCGVVGMVGMVGLVVWRRWVSALQYTTTHHVSKSSSSTTMPPLKRAPYANSSPTCNRGWGEFR